MHEPLLVQNSAVTRLHHNTGESGCTSTACTPKVPSVAETNGAHARTSMRQPQVQKALWPIASECTAWVQCKAHTATAPNMASVGQASVSRWSSWKNGVPASAGVRLIQNQWISSNLRQLYGCTVSCLLQARSSGHERPEGILRFTGD